MFSSRTASWIGPGVLFLSTGCCDDVTLFVLSTSFNHFTIFGESIEFLPSLKPTPTHALSNGMAKGARFKHYGGSWLQTSVGVHHTMTGRSGNVALWKQWYVGQSVPLRAIYATEDVCTVSANAFSCAQYWDCNQQSIWELISIHTAIHNQHASNT